MQILKYIFIGLLIFLRVVVVERKNKENSDISGIINVHLTI